MIQTLCPKHSKRLTEKSAVKIFRWARKCATCLAGVRQEPPALCPRHNELYDEWQKKQISKIKCEDCQ